MTCHLCDQPITDRQQINYHHIIPKSRGGTGTAPTHKACHVEHHSKGGDFREWGRKGGLITAATWIWIFNLKIGKGPPDPLRRIPFGG